MLQIIRFIIQISVILLVIFTGFKNDLLGQYLIPFIIIFGVFYCGWFCPFGTAQEFVGKIGKTLKIKKYKLPDKIQAILVYLRYIIYALSFIGLISMVWNPRGKFSMILRGFEISYILYGIVIIFLLISLFIDRPWCNYLCEKGGFFGLLSSFRFFGIKRDQKKCVHCLKCNKTCPMNIKIETMEFVNHPSCIGCMQCITNCPKKCLKYNFK